MRYFGFLARFVVIPLIIIRLILWFDKNKNRSETQTDEPLKTNWSENQVLIGHAITAVSYTTIWDNYLVARGIWGYDKNLVNGMRIGWVPIEEYSFFVLQTLLTGSWMQFIARKLEPESATTPMNPTYARYAPVLGLGAIWILAARSLIKPETRDNYLGLILAWALPPIMFQIGFGGDILWRNRKLLAASILPSTAYLGFSDSLAIEAGTWHINPDKTIKVDVIPNLPFEELLFFFLTNVLLSFGVTLVQSKESENRLPESIKPYYLQLKDRIIQ